MIESITSPDSGDLNSGIIESSNTNLFEVGTISISDLFKSDVQLQIPAYQRPYVWTSHHIEEVLSDWSDHFFKEQQYDSEAIEYYMGAIMIHNNNGNYEIIDGQQRLTTLLIFDYVWNCEKSVVKNGRFNFNYKSKKSAEHIKTNRNYIDSIKGGLVASHFEKIVKKLVFSIIITDSEDKAFVFFDSQNNRGVPLDEVDFFKSYHLRELNGHPDYLTYFAKKFDQINALNNSKSRSQPHLQSLNELFIKQLWRVRFWSNNKLRFATRKSLLETFQKNTVSFDEVDDIKLYPSFNNSLGSSLRFDKQMRPEINSTIRLFGSESIDIPFTINQPIQKGIGFFLYTEKYTSLFNYIFREKKVEEINEITSLIYRLHNNYFVNLYQVAIILYYDKFATEKICQFSRWLEHYLGAFRMNRASIVEQSPIVLLRDYGNILMIIQQAYLPEEIIHAIRVFVPEKYYSGFTYEFKDGKFIIGNASGILSQARQNYYQLVKEFYSELTSDKNYQLTEKQNWINGRFNL